MESSLFVAGFPGWEAVNSSRFGESIVLRTQANAGAEAKKEIASISKEMNPQQIADAQEKAKKCKASKYEQCD
jgi:hypothetical protein